MFFRCSVIALVVFGVSLLTHGQGTFTSIRDLAYAGDTLNSHQLDLHIPNGVAGPLPVIIWIHGGGWQSGDKNLGAQAFQLRYARNGYVVASLNYRLSGESIFPAQIHDCKSAIRWLRANAAEYNLDPNRFGVWGSSAGGHLAALVATSGDVSDLEGTVGGNAVYSSRVHAVVDWYGPIDLLQMDAQALSQGCAASGHNNANSPESLLIGCQIQTCPEAVQRANPLTYFTDDDPPFFIQHGTADCTVPMGQSQMLQTLLLSAGHRTTFVPLSGAGHGGPQFNAETNLQRVDQFFETMVKGRIPTPLVLEGRVMTLGGVGIRNARVTLTDASGSAVTATTSSFGNYQFAGIAPGEVYTISVSSKRYRFAPMVTQLIANRSGMDMFGLE